MNHFVLAGAQWLRDRPSQETISQAQTELLDLMTYTKGSVQGPAVISVLQWLWASQGIPLEVLDAYLEEVLNGDRGTVSDIETRDVGVCRGKCSCAGDAVGRTRSGPCC